MMSNLTKTSQEQDTERASRSTKRLAEEDTGDVEQTKSTKTGEEEPMTVGEFRGDLKRKAEPPTDPRAYEDVRRRTISEAEIAAAFQNEPPTIITEAVQLEELTRQAQDVLDSGKIPPEQTREFEQALVLSKSVLADANVREAVNEELNTATTTTSSSSGSSERKPSALPRIVRDDVKRKFWNVKQEFSRLSNNFAKDPEIARLLTPPPVLSATAVANAVATRRIYNLIPTTLAEGSGKRRLAGTEDTYYPEEAQQRIDDRPLPLDTGPMTEAEKALSLIHI
jgi:hypothetical protein